MKRSTRAFGASAVLALVLVTATPMPALAVDYPSWEDLAGARSSEAASQAAIQQIEALIAGLQSAAEAARIDEETKGALWRDADDRFQSAAQETLALQAQADAAAELAAESGLRASQVAAHLARTGSQDLTANLLLGSGGDTDDLLYYMGMSAKVSQQASIIYDAALLDRNTAQALTDQADVAKAELDVLRQEAEALFAEAQAATIAAAAAVAEQQANEARLQAQLIVLKEKRAATEADYAAGVEARRAAGVGLSGGAVSSAGWALPASGRITSPFGGRVHPITGNYSSHQGTDIGARCNQPIYAANGGTVIYAGRNGGYGNFVLINHGGGISTAYAHIVDGGILVGYGETVSVGQNIALVGTTGTSTGCHLHFEVRNGGVAINAAAFMADRGITLG